MHCIMVIFWHEDMLVSLPTDEANLSVEGVCDEVLHFRNDDKECRCIGCYGIFSDAFAKEYLHHPLHDLMFVHSTTGSRMSRVSSKNPGMLFLISGTLYEAIEMTPLEHNLVDMLNSHLCPMKQCLVCHAHKIGKQPNPSHFLEIDTLQTSAGPIYGTGYDWHTDVNGLLCDDGIDVSNFIEEAVG